MTGDCSRCGVGHRLPGEACDWCGAPRRPRVPLWIEARRRLLRSRVAAALRRRGPIVTGVGVGVVLHLMVTAIGVLFGQPPLWQIGLFWSEQWWWALVPEHAQPWGFAVEQGAVYGALAGLVAASHVASPRRGASPSPATVTTLAAFLLSGWDSIAHTQHQLVMAVLGAAVGRWTTLVLRGRR